MIEKKNSMPDVIKTVKQENGESRHMPQVPTEFGLREW